MINWSNGLLLKESHKGTSMYRVKSEKSCVLAVILYFISVLSFLSVSGCAPEREESEIDSFKMAIRAKYDLKEEAFRKNEVAPILTKFYSENVISTDKDGNTHIGRDALEPIYEEVIVADVRIEPFNTFVKGDAGWDWVNFYVTFPPEMEVAPFTFKMLFLWERVGGEWWSNGEMYVLGEFDLNDKPKFH